MLLSLPHSTKSQADCSTKGVGMSGMMSYHFLITANFKTYFRVMLGYFIMLLTQISLYLSGSNLDIDLVLQIL
jgi:hypothetical protein